MHRQNPYISFKRLQNRNLGPRLSVRSMAGRHLVFNHDGLENGIKELLASPGPHYVLFSSDLDSNSGRPWCPDCVRAVPAVISAVNQVGGSVAEVRVGERALWKSPSHPLRLDAKLKLTGIPTLFKWTPDGPSQREPGALEAASTDAAALSVAQDFVNSTR